MSIQLSENASDLSTLEEDDVSLVNHIREKCGKDVRILIIDDFWSDEKSQIKKNVSDKVDVVFVDLSDIRGKDQYKASLGTVVKGDDGKKHTIEHDGVAAHPGDEGMEAIAEKVLDAIE